MITINNKFNIEKLSRTIFKIRIDKYIKHKQNILNEVLTLWVLDYNNFRVFHIYRPSINRLR